MSLQGLSNTTTCLTSADFYGRTERIYVGFTLWQQVWISQKAIIGQKKDISKASLLPDLDCSNDRNTGASKVYEYAAGNEASLNLLAAHYHSQGLVSTTQGKSASTRIFGVLLNVGQEKTQSSPSPVKSEKAATLT